MPGYTTLPLELTRLVLEHAGVCFAAPVACRAWRDARARIRTVDFAPVAETLRDDVLSQWAQISFPACTSITLRHGIAISDAGLCSLFSGTWASRLTSIDLTSTFGTGDVTLRAIGVACPVLRSLAASGCAKCSDSGFKAVARGAAASGGALRVLRLESLTFSFDFLTDRGARFVARGGAGATLTELDVSGNGGLSLRGVRDLAEMRALRRLALRHCERADDTWCTALADGVAASADGALACVDLRGDFFVSRNACNALACARMRGGGDARPSAMIVVLSEHGNRDHDEAGGGGEPRTDGSEWGSHGAPRGFEDPAFSDNAGAEFGGFEHRPDKVGCYKSSQR
jgi:hypothetical protein